MVRRELHDVHAFLHFGEEEEVEADGAGELDPGDPDVTGETQVEVAVWIKDNVGTHAQEHHDLAGDDYGTVGQLLTLLRWCDAEFLHIVLQVAQYSESNIIFLKLHMFLIDRFLHNNLLFNCVFRANHLLYQVTLQRSEQVGVLMLLLLLYQTFALLRLLTFSNQSLFLFFKKGLTVCQFNF